MHPGRQIHFRLPESDYQFLIGYSRACDMTMASCLRRMVRTIRVRSEKPPVTADRMVGAGTSLPARASSGAW
jgi:hypothetical protein